MKKKKSGFLGTAVVAVLVASLAGYAYFFEFKKGKEIEEKKKQDALVLQMKKDEVDRIEMHRKSGAVTLERGTDGTWRITSPVQDTTDNGAMDLFLDQLTTEKSEEVIAEGDAVDWKTYGLDEPVTRFIAKGKGGVTREVKIGSVKSFDGQLHARINDEKKVLLVGSLWDAHLSKPVNDLRDKRLLRSSGTDFSNILIRRGGNKIVLERKDGKWTFTSGSDNTIPVGEAQVSSFLEAIRALRATDIASESKDADAAKYGFKGAIDTHVELSAPGAAPFALDVSTKTPTAVDKTARKEDDSNFRFATSSESAAVFKINLRSAQDLAKVASDFFDKKFPFRMAEGSLSQLEINSSAVKLKAKKEPSGWVLADPGLQKDLDTAKLEDVVSRIGNLEAARFRGKARGKGIDPAKNTITMADPTGKTLLRLNWGDVYSEKGTGGAETKLVDIKTSQSDQTFSVPDYAINEMPLKELLKDKPASPASAQAPESKPGVSSSATKTN